jgi:hypothetical protein
MTTMTHHLTGRWVVDEQEGVGNHHHLKEVWVDEDEPPAVNITRTQHLEQAA